MWELHGRKALPRFAERAHGLPYVGDVDDGQDAGWLIFKMPPAEMGIHPGEKGAHEVSFMCDDLTATMTGLGAKGVVFEGDPIDEGWEIAVKMILLGDVEVLLYEPRHNTAI